VESEIFRNPQTSREHINVNVVGGIVELRGEQAAQGDIDRLVQAVKGIPNVKGVHNYLHLPGTPAPNKESAIEAS
jgi:osmotically-inducible protein OsmY